ncbi:conjugal transfer protein TraR [Sphingomonas alpina]|uniref:Conjugal transfer protein TraR n=1 Tax=Sphingomonas alpina TaxID=653931 RepID=A0A7H0LHY6_9SPHN|nr:conjugal transfer protein TraR [Sphingomonas alpina]QNQ09289.1 conjugal transfer protein TraR [Sphingomonas alpina]
MADEADLAAEIEAEHLARGIAAARQPIPEGKAGECDGCGEDMGRLVNGKCGYCRDGRRRPPAMFRGPPPEQDA